MDDNSKLILDCTSVSTCVASLFGWLPEVAAIFTIIWTCIRIYETNTFQKLLKKFRKKADAS